MLTLGARIYVAAEAIDLRKGFDAPAAATREIIREDPLSGHWFVFVPGAGPRRPRGGAHRDDVVLRRRREVRGLQVCTHRERRGRALEVPGGRNGYLQADAASVFDRIYNGVPTPPKSAAGPMRGASSTRWRTATSASPMRSC